MFLAFFSFVLLAQRTSAETSPEVLVGSIVNSWSQARMQASNNVFDLAIQGNGFFVLQLANEEGIFSRYGELSLAMNGNLIHSATQGKVLGFCEGVLQPINLKPFARDKSGTVVKAFRIELDGKIMAFYESGNAHQTCTVALAIFSNPRKLLRNKHALSATAESGNPSIAAPQEEGRGSIYSAALEELDDQTYLQNMK